MLIIELCVLIATVQYTKQRRIWILLVIAAVFVIGIAIAVTVPFLIPSRSKLPGRLINLASANQRYLLTNHALLD